MTGDEMTKRERGHRRGVLGRAAGERAWQRGMGWVSVGVLACAAGPSFADPTLSLVRTNATGPVHPLETVTVQLRMSDLGADQAASLRPEKIALLAAGAAAPEGAIAIEGRVDEVLFHGAAYRVEVVAADAGRLVLSVPAAAGDPPPKGARVRAAFSRDALHLMEPE